MMFSVADFSDSSVTRLHVACAHLRCLHQARALAWDCRTCRAHKQVRCQECPCGRGCPPVLAQCPTYAGIAEPSTQLDVFLAQLRDGPRCSATEGRYRVRMTVVGWAPGRRRPRWETTGGGVRHSGFHGDGSVPRHCWPQNVLPVSSSEHIALVWLVVFLDHVSGVSGGQFRSFPCGTCVVFHYMCGPFLRFHFHPCVIDSHAFPGPSRRSLLFELTRMSHFLARSEGLTNLSLVLMSLQCFLGSYDMWSRYWCRLVSMCYFSYPSLFCGCPGGHE